MANITNELSNIKNAVLGKDVRSSIHDGIYAINKEVESTTQKQSDLNDKQDALNETFKNLVINAGNSNAEVAASRGSYDYLPDRLAAVDEQFNTITIEKLDKNGIVTMANMGQDVKEAMTGGSVAVVGDNAILTDNIVNKQITYEKLSSDIVTINESYNRLDLTKIANVNIGSGGQVSNSDSNYAVRIRVTKGDKYKLFDINTDGKTFRQWLPRIAITDKNNTTLSFYIENTSEFEITDVDAYYLYVWQRGAIRTMYETNKCMILKNYSSIPVNFIPFYDEIKLNAVPKNLSDYNNDLSEWKNKKIVFYGDSITAQGNYVAGVTDNKTGYGYYAELEHKFNAIYRGVGGQAFKKNSNTWYANEDGSYAGRYGSGGLISPPSGTTTHLGYFSSWDRITASIPLATRTTIDMVIISGGHNDFASVEDVPTDGVIKASEPKWITNCDYDTQWKNSSVYNGGDYDITTFTGAIASTIMKLQIWCPNAIIVLATPFPRWDLTNMQQMKNGELTFRQLCEIEIATANYMQVPVIDLNANCGINVTNYNNATQSDNVHPNELGRKLYGRALIGELYKIYPKI